MTPKLKQMIDGLVEKINNPSSTPLQKDEAIQRLFGINVALCAEMPESMAHQYSSQALDDYFRKGV